MLLFLYVLKICLFGVELEDLFFKQSRNREELAQQGYKCSATAEDSDGTCGFAAPNGFAAANRGTLPCYVQCRLASSCAPVNCKEIRLRDVHYRIFQEAAEKVKDQDIILLLGGTGAGKSTAILYLGGADMEERYVDGKRHIGAVDNEKLTEPLKTAVCWVAQSTVEL